MDGFTTLSPDVLPTLVRCFDLLQAKGGGSGRSPLLDRAGYYEFGLYQGFSFWFAEQLSRQYAGAGFGHYGFDSFAGLPRPQLKMEAAMFAEGDFAGSYDLVTGNLERWGADPARYKLYEGFYSDQLFARFAAAETFRPVAMALIDVDLYESTVPVLTFLRPLLAVGSILLFDDYNQAAPGCRPPAPRRRRRANRHLSAAAHGRATTAGRRPTRKDQATGAHARRRRGGTGAGEGGHAPGGGGPRLGPPAGSR
jgi:hypothetical protein